MKSLNYIAGHTDTNHLNLANPYTLTSDQAIAKIKLYGLNPQDFYDEMFGKQELYLTAQVLNWIMIHLCNCSKCTFNESLELIGDVKCTNSTRFSK